MPKFINTFCNVSTSPSCKSSLVVYFKRYVCIQQVHAVIGVLMDDTDPLVTVMKVEKAPQETYADIGGLDNQIQEIKVNPTSVPYKLLIGSIKLTN